MVLGCHQRAGRLAVLITAGLLAACGDPAPAGVAGTGGPDVPDTTSITMDIPINMPETSPPLDGSDDAGEVEIVPGGPGWPCDVNDDCDSDWCIQTAEGKRCSELCVENCTLSAWGCVQVQTLGDPANICVPLFDRLCDPCDSDADCSDLTSTTGAVCLEREDGQGSFCGGDCSTNVSCPEGYTCEEHDLGAGGIKKQCVPTSGVCTCSESAVARKASTTCRNTSELGTCVGARVCTEEGLSGCSAGTPSEETCDGADNDCDGATDEPDAGGCETYYKDLDDDGYGIDGDSRCLCAPDDTHRAVEAGDCDDKALKLNPGEPELCDAIDNDCDGTTDEEDALGCKDYWADMDADTWGDPESGKCLCEPDAIFSSQKVGDCDDEDEDTFPGAPETCSGKDQNCDEQVGPENTPGCTNYYLDADKDEFGVTGDVKCLCAPSAPYSALEPGDCDDAKPAINPGASEACDTFDNDCDNNPDPPGSDGCQMWLKDADQDNFGVTGDGACLCQPEAPYDTQIGGDCDDTTGNVSPDVPEKCNGIDDDCDGGTDEAGATGCQSYYHDGDEDDYGVQSDLMCLCGPTAPYSALEVGDCDDGKPFVNPGEPEQCGNDVDDDCSGTTDEEGGQGCEEWLFDGDGDDFGADSQVKCLCEPTGKFVVKEGGDCLDTDDEVNPDATEVCGDEIDNDCDDATDEEGATGCSPYYLDADADDYGVTGTEKCLCGPTGQHTAQVPGDCKDTNDLVNPGTGESCNSLDDDCNGITDDEGAAGCTEIWLDADGDTFGVPNSQKCLCGAQGHYKADKGGDCDDDDVLNYPGQPCEGASCSGHTLTEALICSGTGKCDQGGAVAPCPGGYVCANDSGCKTACTTDQDCVSGNFCVAGVCTGKKLDGSACLDDSQCQSDHCQNGFCCASSDCCGGAASHCNDDNTCTTEGCNAAFQCIHTPNTAQCAVGFCDGDTYTAPQFCDGGTCSAGGAVSTCDTDDPCLVASCTLAGCSLKNAKAGVQCETASCAGGQITAPKSCDGSGGCAVGGSTTPCPGGFTCQSAAACHVACEDGSHCRDGFYCDGGLCLPEKGDGTSCKADAECQTGHCQNGFCCDGGKCCAKSTDCDDGNVCTSDTCLPTFQCANPPNTVQCKAGSCDGTTYTEPAFCSGGVCAVGGEEVACDTDNPCLFDTCSMSGCGTSPVPIGTPCQAPACSGHLLTAQKACNGAGTCSLGGSTKACPGGVTCTAEGDGCRTGCESDAHCQPGLYCDAGLCLPQKAAGEPCSAIGQCLSGHCENGFCCAEGKCCGQASHCDDGNVCTTDSCSTAKKCTYVYNTVSCEAGSCDGLTWTAPRTCSQGACTVGGGVSECDLGNPCRNYTCDATQGCSQTSALNGTVCKEPVCVGSLFTGAHTCQSGQCQSPGAAPCPGGNMCASPVSCSGGCEDDNDCQSGWYCATSGSCQPRRGNGDICLTDNQCQSGHCDNGFCCATGKCCNKAADCDDDNVCTTDTCSASFICATANNTAQCASGTCAGLTWTAPKTCSSGTCSAGGSSQGCGGSNPCKTYACTEAGCEVDDAAAGTQCAPASCTTFILTAPTTCDGSGTCGAGGTSSPCAGGYRCLDATSCRTSCAGDTHCAPGYYCGNGACQPRRINGDACQQNTQCSSGYCANGYCCNGPDGDCCAQNFHCDDGNPCTTDTCGMQFACEFSENTSLCQGASCDGLIHTAESFCLNGECTDGGGETNCGGTNPCKSYACTASGCQTTNVATGIQCAAQTCTGHTLVQAKTCNATGSCSGGGSSAPCAAGLTCLDGTFCRSSCSLDSHCQPGFFCQSGSCQSKRPAGDPCTTATQCQSGYCGGGYCCEDDGTGVSCCGGSNTHCDDGLVCTADVCGTGYVCQNTATTGNECAPASCNVSGGTRTYTGAKYCHQGDCVGGSTANCPADQACRRFPCTQENGCMIQDEPAGTPCGTGSCSGHTLTGSQACDGSGNCVESSASGPCPGGFTCLNSTSCRTSCQTDEDCQAGLVCQDGVACVAKKANGQQCTDGAQCLSGYCNSGYCCDGGTCCQTAAHCNDDNVCTTDQCASNSCQHTSNTLVCEAGSCDGTVHTPAKVCTGGVCPVSSTTQDCLPAQPNACKTYACTSGGCLTGNAPAGTQCQPSSCVGSTLTQARTCDGGGGCNQGGTPAACPGNLKCADATSCKSSCSQHGDCVSGYYCNGGACLARKSNGATCNVSDECQSGYCNSNVCCAGGECCQTNGDCNDGNSCTTNLCSSFQCTTTFDTGEVCQASSCSGLTYTAPRTCDATGACTQGGGQQSCGGSNVCLVYACSATGCTQVPASSGTACAPASCTGDVITQATTCDGAGNCTVGGSTAVCPGGYGCLSETACRTSCTQTAHCQDGYYCQTGSCLLKKDNGATCNQNKECVSDHCAGGYCCDDGLCCGNDVDCNDGNQCTDDLCVSNQCTTVNNNATCGLGECNGLIHTSPNTCEGGACTGGGASQDCSGSDPCRTYACQTNGCVVGNQPGGTQCVAPVCTGSRLTTAKTCNGSGLCSQGGVSGPCPNNFACKNSTTCNNTCTQNSQCASGAFCQGGACVPLRADGEVCTTANQCQSGYCNAGICCSGGSCCTNSAHCGDGNVCTTDSCQNNTCVWTNNSNQCAASFCTGLTWTAAKYCSGGVCTGGGATTDCSGTNACLTYTCGNLAGCGNTPKDETTVCREPTCAGTVFTPASLCNGNGSCVHSDPQQCDDGQLCTGAEACSTTQGCQSGNPSAVWVCGDGTCNHSCESASTCAGDCTCTDGYTLSIGEVDAWSTNETGSTNRLSQYGCNANSYPGREYTYELVAPQSGQIKVDLRGADASTDILVLSGSGGVCDPAQCVAQAVGSGGSVTFTAVAGATYYLVVDRRATGSVAYEIYARYPNACTQKLTEDWDRNDYPRGWSSQMNWQSAQDTPFGQWHARFNGSPTLTAFDRTLTSPVFDTTGCASQVKVSFKYRFTEVSPAPAGEGATLTLEASSNGGSSWTELFSFNTEDGNTPPAVTETVTTSAIANTTQAQLRFRVQGPDSSHINRIQIDDITVLTP